MPDCKNCLYGNNRNEKSIQPKSALRCECAAFCVERAVFFKGQFIETFCWTNKGDSNLYVVRKISLDSATQCKDQYELFPLIHKKTPHLKKMQLIGHSL